MHMHRICTRRLQCADVKRLWFGVNRSNEIESILKCKYNFSPHFFSPSHLFEQKQIKLLLGAPASSSGATAQQKKTFADLWAVVGAA